jgi:hypothetical protein
MVVGEVTTASQPYVRPMQIYSSTSAKKNKMKKKSAPKKLFHLNTKNGGTSVVDRQK